MSEYCKAGWTIESGYESVRSGYFCERPLYGVGERYLVKISDGESITIEIQLTNQYDRVGQCIMGYTFLRLS